MSLSLLLVEAGVANSSTVERALARQSLWGADLVTNLIEVAPVEEAQVLAALQKAEGLDRGPSGVLPPLSGLLRDVVPPQIARDLRVYPLDVTDAEVIVAVGARLEDAAVDELGRACSKKVVQRIVLAQRLSQALSSEYGVPLDPRDVDVLARLESGGAEDAEERWFPSFDAIPRPPSEPPRPESLWPPGAPATSGLYDAAGPFSSSRVPRGRHPSRGRIPHRGPMTPGDAHQKLRDATSRAEVLAAFFDFSAQFFEYTALFSLHDGVARGWDAQGPGASRAVVARLEVPIESSSALGRVQHSGQPQVIQLREQGADRDLSEALRRPSDGAVLFVPVQVRGKPVLVLYGDERGQSIALENVGEVVALAPLVGLELERIIVQAKRASLLPTAKKRYAMTSMPPLPERPKLPSEAERVAALLDVLEQNEVSTARVEEPRVEESVPPPGRSLSEPVFPLSRRASNPGEGVDSATEFATWTVPKEAPTERVEVVPEPAPLTERSEIPLAELGSARREEHAMVAPLPRTMVSELTEAPLPVVVEADTEDLVRRVCNGDESALSALSDLGSAALPAVMRHFPGPLSVSPGFEDIRQSAVCGPLLHVVRATGTDGVPGLIQLLKSEREEVAGAWALLVLAETGGSAAVSAVAEEITRNRVVWKRFAGLLVRVTEVVRSSSAASEQAVAQVLSILKDDSQPHAVRQGCVEAIADLRASSAVASLIELLGSDSGLAATAEEALRVLTRQNLGTEMSAWRNWWGPRAGRHRIEWLIEALGSESESVRSAASEELKSESKEYFGYYADLPVPERKRAQQRYVQWWESVGRARFR